MVQVVCEHSTNSAQASLSQRVLSGSLLYRLFSSGINYEERAKLVVGPCELLHACVEWNELVRVLPDINFCSL
jgi:hypothetical protein